MQRKRRRHHHETIRRKFHDRIDEDTFLAIIGSCTLQELTTPAMVLASPTRIARIVRGSGRRPSEVRLLFKTSVATGELLPSRRVFYETKAKSLADALSRELGGDVSADQVLRGIDDAYEDELPQLLGKPERWEEHD